MPLSKRHTPVSLTQTGKKTRDHKNGIVDDIRTAIDAHTSVYLFSYENMRSNKFKNIRVHFHPESRIFLGKNKLMQLAMGRTPEEEHGDNLRRMSEKCSGSVGLLMTSRGRKEVEEYFHGILEKDFSRAGSVASRDVVLTKEDVSKHPVSMVELFRKLGMPVEVQVGKIGFMGDKSEHVVCKTGQTMTAEICKLLVHFGIMMSEFKVQLVSRWEDGNYESYE